MFRRLLAAVVLAAGVTAVVAGSGGLFASGGGNGYDGTNCTANGQNCIAGSTFTGNICQLKSGGWFCVTP